MWRQPKIQIQKESVKFVVSFTFTTRLNSGIGLPNIVRIYKLQTNLSAKISRSESYTKILNYSSLRGTIDKRVKATTIGGVRIT